jgi:predicted esterase
MRTAVLLLLALPLAAILAGPAAAQAERYELGRRLKEFEREWEEQTDPAARKRALAILPGASTRFLSLQPGEAGRALDAATHALGHGAPPTAAQEWAAALCAIPEKRLIDGGVEELTVTVKPLYPVKAAIPKGFTVTVGFAGQKKLPVPTDKFPAVVKVPVPPLDKGDREFDRFLSLEVTAGEAGGLELVPVAQVADLAGRLANLKAAIDKWPALDTPEKATARDYAELLAGAADGAVPETDLNLGQMLRHAEHRLGPDPWYTADLPGDFRFSVPLGGKQTAPIRMEVPQRLDPKKPVPLVVALHGAGGSENLFFEGYGRGRIVKECTKRGWLLVAPRGGLVAVPPVAEIIAKLAERYPIDRKRVFLVGHSMGAAQAVELVQRHPGTFAAAACLGGGGRVRKPEALADLPLFIGVGSKDDLALAGARALNKALSAAGAKRVAFKEYPALEHMLIVREALPDVFAAFDRVAGGGR